MAGLIKEWAKKRKYYAYMYIIGGAQYLNFAIIRFIMKNARSPSEQEIKYIAYKNERVSSYMVKIDVAWKEISHCSLAVSDITPYQAIYKKMKELAQGILGNCSLLKSLVYIIIFEK